jgi:excisionase family DNA binding protein
MSTIETSQEVVIASGSMPEWLTLEQAAAYLKISTQTLYRWVDDGRLVAYELPAGRGRRFKRDDLDGLLTPSGGGVQALVDLGVAEASARGHDMENVTSDSQSALYKCRHCGETFTVGYPDIVEGRAQARRLQLLAASVLKMPCPGRPGTNRRDQAKQELGRLVEDMERGRVTDEAATRQRVAELRDELQDPANAAYDRGAVGLIKRADQALKRL